jgi:hypothetical protein
MTLTELIEKMEVPPSVEKGVRDYVKACIISVHLPKDALEAERQRPWTVKEHQRFVMAGGLQ